MINIVFVNKKLKEIKADIELVFVVNKNFNHQWIKDAQIFDFLSFSGNEDEVLFLPEKRIIYIGIVNATDDNLRQGAALALRKLRKTKAKSIKLGLYGHENDFGARALAEGFYLGAYQYSRRFKKEQERLKRIYLASEFYNSRATDFSAIKSALSVGKVIAQSVNFTRNLVNTPPSELTPVELVVQARKMARENGLTVMVKGKDFLQKQKMGAFLAVNRASSYPPQLIHLRYKPKKFFKKIVLVGKGLTYDTGGLSLKPSNAMMTMKMDMGGAAAALGVIKAVSKLALPVSIDVILGVTENAIGKDAYKPDDILTAKNGKTIEVINTDAEGRLVLADCLCYAQEQNPDYLIDIATLTGAAMIALGNYTAGVMGFNEELKKELLSAAVVAGEYCGTLPFNKFLQQKIKSKIADIRNIATTKYGGAITAALFLAEFIEDKNKPKWAHLDIAGPAYVEEDWGVNSFGATGAGVRTLVSFIINIVKKHNNK